MIEEFDMDDVMFIVGAQTTDDGDMVPLTFMVFSRFTEPEDATRALMDRIISQLEELNIERASGSIEFRAIRSWEEFAEVEVNDQTKMKALASSITSMFMTTIADVNDEKVSRLASLPWLPLPS